VDIHVVGEGLLGLVAGGLHDEARVHAGVGHAALGAHLVQFLMPVLGLYHGLSAQVKSVALRSDGELDLGDAIAGQAVEARLAGDFHRLPTHVRYS
jgi:hypothetical protein